MKELDALYESYVSFCLSTGQIPYYTMDEYIKEHCQFWEDYISTDWMNRVKKKEK